MPASSVASGPSRALVDRTALDAGALAPGRSGRFLLHYGSYGQAPVHFREYFEALLIAGIFLGFTNTFLVKTFYIPSASMEETLLVGDHLFVNRFIYGPPRGRRSRAARCAASVAATW